MMQRKTFTTDIHTSESITVISSKCSNDRTSRLRRLGPKQSILPPLTECCPQNSFNYPGHIIPLKGFWMIREAQQDTAISHRLFIPQHQEFPCAASNMEAHNLNFLMTTQPAASLSLVHLRFTISPAILYLVTTRSSAMVCSSSWSLMMNSCANLALHVDSKNPTGGKQGEGPPRQAPFRQVTREAPLHSSIASSGCNI